MACPSIEFVFHDIELTLISTAAVVHIYFYILFRHYFQGNGIFCACSCVCTLGTCITFSLWGINGHLPIWSMFYANRQNVLNMKKILVFSPLLAYVFPTKVWRCNSLPLITYKRILYGHLLFCWYMGLLIYMSYGALAVCHCRRKPRLGDEP